MREYLERKMFKFRFWIKYFKNNIKKHLIFYFKILFKKPKWKA